MLHKSNTRPRRGQGAATRTRRAYFDVRFGQLHVRTAFPATGGFDEQTPLLCLHPADGTGRLFERFIAAMAERRSVYAPDLPGCGESDPPPADAGLGAGAAAIEDFAADLRLRRVDLLGVGDGSQIALDVAASAPALVRRIVLIGASALNRLTSRSPECLLVMTGEPSAQLRQRAQALRSNLEVLEVPECADDAGALAADALAERLTAFLDRR
ncbi:MAG TPA: alpha/beta fold hydrolase [Steroidobacteraceae bacterium]|nr:alpha/beta fold hydrolase [Steroidobacteraceae bacterium]